MGAVTNSLKNSPVENSNCGSTEEWCKKWNLQKEKKSFYFTWHKRWQLSEALDVIDILQDGAERAKIKNAAH